MQPETRFTALRTDSEEDRRPTFEMLDMEPSEHDSHRPCNSMMDEKNCEKTLREKMATFPRKTFFIISLLPFALAPIIILATAAEKASVSYIQGRECYPNGMWKETPGATWRIMDSSYFFTPNLSFGSMSFTQVKVIDIAWDLLVGRGGQVLLAWVNYRVFNEWILYHMELHFTSYKMYTAVAFETTTLATLGVLAKEFLAFGKSTWVRFFRWLAMLSMVLSTLYVLAFPTLMAAMTGYITTYRSYIEDYDQNLVEESKFQPVRFVVQDSVRLNYSRPLICTYDDTELREYIDDYWHEFIGVYELHSEPMAPYNITGLNNKSSIWTWQGKEIKLAKPTLNITIYQRGDPARSPSPGIVHQYYGLGGPQGDLFNGTWVHEHGSCQPSETYQWGFSYIFLFMMSIFNFVWSCIMIGMWFDTCRGSRMYKSGRRPGLLRSILDLSAAIKEELGSDVGRMEESELRQRLRESGSALMVPPKELRVARASTGDETRKRSWRRNLTKGSTF